MVRLLHPRSFLLAGSLALSGFVTALHAGDAIDSGEEELKTPLKMVAVCADSPEEVRKGKGKHGLEALMLSDRSLAAADALELRNIGAMSAPRPVPVPTSVIVDANGERWTQPTVH